MTSIRWFSTQRSTFALLGAMTCACFMLACEKKGTPEVTKQAFGATSEGASVERYTLSNANGMQAGILTYGGTVA